jgi:hypothetical protein
MSGAPINASSAKSPDKTLRPALSDSSVAVVGVARNCGETLMRDVARLRAGFAAAGELRFLVVESDSSDNTLDQLEHLRRSLNEFTYVSMGSLTNRFPVRTERIAHCRNRYLSELNDHPRFAGVDYVVVADLDGVNNRLDAKAVATCWSSAIDWSVCTANQRDLYYDVWALRHDGWCPDDCWALYRRLVPLIGEAQALALAVHARMIHIDPAAPMIEVASAFGGLAIYKAGAVQKARYCGQIGGQAISEHVPLHEAVSAAGHRIFINPALLNAASTSHSWNKTRVAQLARSLLPGVYQPDPEGVAAHGAAYSTLRKLKRLLH